MEARARAHAHGVSSSLAIGGGVLWVESGHETRLTCTWTGEKGPGAGHGTSHIVRVCTQR